MQRFAAQKRSSLTAKKNAHCCCEEGCTNNISLQAEGVDLRIYSTTLAYPLQKKHHPV